MKGRILILADGRSPTALSWIDNVLSLGYQVSLISTFPCQEPEGLEGLHILPVAFSRFSGGTFHKSAASQPQRTGLKSLIRRHASSFQTLRYLLGPLTLHRYTNPLKDLIREIQPDLVHALRIPYEGMLGAATPEGIPFIAATWGNDLTLHANGSFLMRKFTHRCLERADGMTSDTHRDVQLAQSWGLNPEAPTLVVPGSGGLDLKAIQESHQVDLNSYHLPESYKWVINPRGIRPESVHQEVFLAAIPKVLAKRPETAFLCPALAGKHQIETLVREYNIQGQVFLLPKLPQSQLWALMKKAQVFVSPSSHDGTPNTLLEAMACGCFPVVGDIDSTREWIEADVNGLLVNPKDPQELADAILKGLDSSSLRHNAAERNLALIQSRAAREATLPEIDRFYTHFLN